MALTSYFYVDGSAPTMSGASTSQTGKYTNGDIAVAASDSGSGLKYIYYKSPVGTGFTSTDHSTKTFNSSYYNGLYTFYAEDKAGNKSPYYYVVLDTEAPTGTIKNSSGTTLTTAYTNEAFSYSATDTSSGVDYLQYKIPSSNSWKTYTAGTTIAATEDDGLYTFRAVDVAGNTSAETSIYLDTTSPRLSLYGGTTSATNGSTVYTDYIKAVCNDFGSGLKAAFVKKPGSSNYESYISETQLTALGTYSFYCVDNANNETSVRTITLASAHTHSYTSTLIPPTCTDNGYTNYICSCGDSYTGDETASLGHNFSDWVTTTDAACTSSGIRTSYCSRCNQTKTETITSLGHSYTELVSSTGDGCLEAGTSVYKCVRCTSTQTITGAAMGHDFSKVINTTGNGCLSAGSVTYQCSRCTATKVETSGAALGHSYTVLVSSKGDSCTTSGTSVYKCSRCSSTQTVTGNALGHNYKAETTSATCTQGGYTTNTCTRCGDSYKNNSTSALGHNYIRTATEATCTEGGGVKFTCSRCADSYITVETLPLGHAYVEEVVEASCTAKGYVLHTCERCGNEYKTDEVLPKGHSYKTNIISAASCESDGERYYNCENCGNNYKTRISATGHTNELKEELNEGGTVKRIYACSACGNSYTEEVGEQYAEVSNYVVYLMDEYSPYMTAAFIASAGVWSVGMGVSMVIARRNEDKEKAKKMIVNYVIGIVAIFCIVVACPLLARGIAVLVT